MITLVYLVGNNDNMVFKPGQSGNPSGRKPVDPSVKAMFDKQLPAALSAITSCLQSDDEAIRLKAANIIVEFFIIGFNTATMMAVLTLDPKDTDITPEEWAKVQEIQFNEWCQFWPITPVEKLIDQIRQQEDDNK